MSGWLQAFIVIAAVAIVIQMAILLGVFLQMKEAVKNFTRIALQLQTRIDPILTRTSRILDDSEAHIARIMEDAAEVTRIARTQVQRIDQIVTDTSERVNVEILRADDIVSSTLEVVEEVAATFRSIVTPSLNQASAILSGLRAGLDFVLKQRRRSESDETTQDEELFI